MEIFIDDTTQRDGSVRGVPASDGRKQRADERGKHAGDRLGADVEVGPVGHEKRHTMSWSP